MSPILPKHQMSEEDIKLNYITPAILAGGWKDKITMETKVYFTDGKINLKGNFVFREKPKRANYILYLKANHPIAVVEAKDNNHSVSHNLQQAMDYAQMLDIPFAYSSNGDGFKEYDFPTGEERKFGPDEFPSDQKQLPIISKNPISHRSSWPSWSSPIIPTKIPTRPGTTSALP